MNGDLANIFLVVRYHVKKRVGQRKRWLVIFSSDHCDGQGREIPFIHSALNFSIAASCLACRPLEKLIPVCGSCFPRVILCMSKTEVHQIPEQSIVILVPNSTHDDLPATTTKKYTIDCLLCAIFYFLLQHVFNKYPQIPQPDITSNSCHSSRKNDYLQQNSRFKPDRGA